MMKRLFAVLIATMLIFSLALTASANTIVKLNESTAVHSGPYSYNRTIATYGRGTTFKNAVLVKGEGGKPWYELTNSKGQVGYIPASSVSLVAVTIRINSKCKVYASSTSTESLGTLSPRTLLAYGYSNGRYKLKATKNGKTVTVWIPKNACTNLSGVMGNASKAETSGSGVLGGETPIGKIKVTANAYVYDITHTKIVRPVKKGAKFDVFAASDDGDVLIANADRTRYGWLPYGCWTRTN